MGDAHVQIVYHHAEIIGGRAIGAGDNQIVERFVGYADFAFHQILPSGVAFERGFEAHHRLAAFGQRRQHFARLRPPAAIICGGAFFFGFFAHGFELFFAAIAVISVALLEQLGNHLAVAVEILSLIHHMVFIVVIQAHPMHAVENCVDRFGGGALKVGVFNAQQKFAFVFFGKCP